MEGGERSLTAFELNDEKFSHVQGYDKCYSKYLEDLVMQCLEFTQNDRPNLRQLLYRTRTGLERWEKTYGSVDKPEDELPEFATFPMAREEEFHVGQEAPDHWLGMVKRKKRTAEEAGLAPARPRNSPQAGPPLGNPGPVVMPEIGHTPEAFIDPQLMNWGQQPNIAPENMPNGNPPNMRPRQEKTSVRVKVEEDDQEAASKQKDDAEKVDKSSTQDQSQTETEMPRENGRTGERRSNPIEISDQPPDQPDQSNQSE